MTRAEQKEKKLQEEEKLIKSIEGKLVDGKQKQAFRKTQVWRDFRRKFYVKEQKKLKNGKTKDIPNVDPITLKPLSRTFNLHHMDLDPHHYASLKEDNFKPVNTQSHEVLHWLYGYYRKDPAILDRLKILLDEMCKLNNNKDVRDYK